MAADVRAELLAVIRRLVSAWRIGNADELTTLLHPDVVFVQPHFGGRTDGREACVDGFRDFTSQAKINKYGDTDHAIDVFGPLAMVSFRYELAWEMEGEHHRETGHDLLLLVREEDRWQIVWRTQVPATP
jgi:ketosteroid isomerase-like protein